ncbi:hypothetical protein BCR36DRAFT_242089, partial [Piromyces finnis]
LISFTALNNQPYAKIIFNTSLNSIGYLAMLIMFSWNTLYIIIKRKNCPQEYFIFKRHEKCMIHQSFSCPCTLNISIETFYKNIRKSIDFYKISSSFFEIVNNKLLYINISSKIKLVNFN